MNDQKYLTLALVNPDTHRYYNELTYVNWDAPTSAWIKLDEYPCKSPLRWLGNSVQNIYSKVVETYQLLNQQYPLFKQKHDVFDDNEYPTATKLAHKLEKQIERQYSPIIETIYNFIDDCFGNWKDIDNAVITIRNALKTFDESYYLTDEIKQKLNIDHLDIIEDNEQNGLVNLLLPEYEAKHLQKDTLLITTPFIDYMGDSLQVIYDAEKHYVTDDGNTVAEFQMYCDTETQKNKVNKYLRNLAKEYGCEYVDNEFRKTTNHQMTVQSNNGNYNELENGLNMLLQCLACAHHDLKHHLH